MVVARSFRLPKRPRGSGRVCRFTGGGVFDRTRVTYMDSLPDVIDAVRACVVQVRIGSDGMAPQPIGTGFIIDKSGFVLTARHVSRDGRKAATDGNMQNIRFFAGLAQPNSDNMRGNFTLVGCDVIEEDPRHDLTLASNESESI